MEGIVYVLRRACQWKALPPEFGPPGSAQEGFQEWELAGVCDRLLVERLPVSDGEEGIRWERQALDGAMTKARSGG